jgi:NADPH:quinone reductase-like Zn-dependent oxidoreductase
MPHPNEPQCHFHESSQAAHGHTGSSAEQRIDPLGVKISVQLSFESYIRGTCFMHAAVLHKLGSAPRYEQFEDPVAREGEALISVRADSLKWTDKGIASGKHYASFRELPVVCGVDGVGTLEDGKRVLFGGCRKPFGAMAEKTVAPRAFCFPVPDGLDDATAAAVPNPAGSSWLPLKWRAKLQPGETVLVLGATGAAGKLAIQIAKLLGAGRVNCCRTKFAGAEKTWNQKEDRRVVFIP